MRVFHYTKYQECFDTVLVVLRRSPVTFLALFHHSVMIHVTFWIYLAQEERGAEVTNTWLPIILNSSVHVIMYAYFAYRSLGYKLEEKTLNFVREGITRMQISQFLIILGYYAYFNPYLFPKCNISWFTWLWIEIPVGIILLFFLNFYVQQYFKSGKKGKDTKEE